MIELGALGADEGALILIKRALWRCGVGDRVEVQGEAPELTVHLRAWCRAQGHGFEEGPPRTIIKGAADRWPQAVRSGAPAPDGVVRHPPPTWGLAARGAAVEAGGPEFHYALSVQDEVWTDDAPRLYAQAAAAQWDPATAIDWDAPITHDEDVEGCVVQLMTYLIENEMAALQVPARFLATVHPHFREVVQVLAIQAADEARHIEVFTRRATVRQQALGLSTAGGQASLKTLLEEPDFALASFLLSVLGEGTFLALLRFLATHAPDPVTRQVCRLAAQDEARHVAFGMAHLERHLGLDPSLTLRLSRAVEARHRALRDTAGLNEEVFDALVVLAAGSFDPLALRRGHQAVALLKLEMDQGRRVRLERLGFAPDEAARLSGLHTRNFM